MRRWLSILLFVSLQAQADIPVDCATKGKRITTAREAHELGLRIETGPYGPRCWEVHVYVPIELDGLVGGHASLRLSNDKGTVSQMDLLRADPIEGQYDNSFVACQSVDRAVMTVTYGPYCKDIELVLLFRQKGDSWELSE
jgi:hypothetical protein